MNVSRKLMLIAITSIAIVGIPAASLVYFYTQHKILANETTTLVAETRVVVESSAINLAKADLSLRSLSRLLKKSLIAPPQNSDEAIFDHLVRKDSDSAWRSQLNSIDGRFEAGIFLPPDARLDVSQKRLHLRSKSVIDSYVGSINSPFSNVWFITPEKTEIIYDRGLPNFVKLMAADNDYTKTDWLALGDPVNNSERGLRWTPPLFDPVPQNWMVSAILPVDVSGHWIGNIGHDIYLKDIFPIMFRLSQRYSNEQHFLLDTSGHYIQAGPWQKLLEANPHNFEPDLRHEPDLTRLLANKLELQSDTFNQKIAFQGHEYLAIGMVMHSVGWRYFRLVPIDQIMAPMRQLLYQLFAMVLVIGLLIGFLIDAAVKRNIVMRLQVLANTVRRYGIGEYDARCEFTGDDEIAKTGHEFDAMADHIKATLEAIPDLLFELDLDGRYYAAHYPHADLLAAPHEEIIGKLISDILPPDAATICMCALQEAHEKGWSQGKQFELQVPKGLLWFELSVAIKKTKDIGKPHFIMLSRDITARKYVEAELVESESQMRAILDTALDAVIKMDDQAHILDWNMRAETIFGWSKDEVLGKTISSIIVPEYYRHAHQRSLVRFLVTGEERGLNRRIQITAMRRNGEEFPIELAITPIRTSQSNLFTAFISDISDRKQSEAKLHLAASVFTHAREGIMITKPDTTIVDVNDAFTRITGYSVDEVIGRTPRMLSSGDHDADFYLTMWKSIHKTGGWEGEIWNLRKNGERYPQHLTITSVRDENEVLTNYMATFVDITLRRAAAEEINSLAFYDPLTHLPNRRLLVDRLNQALVSSTRSGRDGALLFLDLDNFKTLNDSLGHDIGDLLLQHVADRLTACVREGDTVARLGGDEYVVMLEDLSEHAIEAAAQAEVIAEKILKALNQVYQLGVHEYYSTPSIGVALFSNHNQSHEDLLKYADIAMYQAKKAGRNAIRFFDPQMQQAIHARVDLERELRKALDKKQFHLYYQAQVDSTGRPTGAEALIRWIHPQRGLISPFNFIPLAEDSGLILPIGQWVLETACAQISAWQHSALTNHLTLSINISARQFRQAGFVMLVQAALLRHNINPALLKLELTESILLDDIEGTIATMNALKVLGIRFSLDDFGTGYSSLQYLKRLPLYQLKIDQSFVRDIAVDSSDQAIVRTIIAMAHTLNLNVIAEGVETEEQQTLLFNNGCVHYQGYLFSKPLPCVQFEEYVKKTNLVPLI